jgi:hypothetical protein
MWLSRPPYWLARRRAGEQASRRAWHAWLLLCLARPACSASSPKTIPSSSFTRPPAKPGAAPEMRGLRRYDGARCYCCCHYCCCRTCVSRGTVQLGWGLQAVATRQRPFEHNASPKPRPVMYTCISSFSTPDINSVARTSPSKPYVRSSVRSALLILRETAIPSE